MSLTLTDNRGLEADQLDMVLSDFDGQLALPTRNAVIELHLGWSDIGLIYKGKYKVAEVEHSGSPDQITVRACSADMGAALNDKRETSFHKVTVGDIVRKIGANHKLPVRITTEIGKRSIAHLDQQNESDINLLTRLAKDHDAIATIKDGALLFIAAGRGQTASGVGLPVATITRADGDQHRFSISDREQARVVKAYYQDTRNAKKGEVTYSGQVEGTKKKSKTIQTDSDSIKTLRHTYASKTNAERAVRSEWQKCQRGVATFSLTLAKGRPDLFPECPAVVQGFKPEIDNNDWLITKLTHSLNDSGLSTQIEFETAQSPPKEND